MRRVVAPATVACARHLCGNKIIVAPRHRRDLVRGNCIFPHSSARDRPRRESELIIVVQLQLCAVSTRARATGANMHGRGAPVGVADRRHVQTWSARCAGASRDTRAGVGSCSQHDAHRRRHRAELLAAHRAAAPVSFAHASLLLRRLADAAVVVDDPLHQLGLLAAYSQVAAPAIAFSSSTDREAKGTASSSDSSSSSSDSSSRRWRLALDCGLRRRGAGAGGAAARRRAGGAVGAARRRASRSERGVPPPFSRSRPRRGRINALFDQQVVASSPRILREGVCGLHGESFANFWCSEKISSIVRVPRGNLSRLWIRQSSLGRAGSRSKRDFRINLVCQRHY